MSGRYVSEIAAAAARAAVALDDLLRRPETAERLRRFGDSIAPGVREQLGAVIGEMTRNAARARSAGLVADVAARGFDEHPQWVTLGLLHAWIEWVGHAGETCLHDPQPSRPQPVAAAAWRPGLVVCARCVHLLVPRAGSAADRTCDGCGRVVDGDEHDDPIWTPAVLFGPMLYSYGCCRDCRYWPDREGDQR